MKIPIRLVRAATMCELEALADGGEAADLAADRWFDLYETTAAQADAAYDRITELERERDAAREQLRAALTAADNERADTKMVREDLARLLEQLYQAREWLDAARRERTVLQGESESLRTIVREVARTLASGAADPTAAVLDTARALLVHAPELRIADDDRVMTALRRLVEPRKVHLLFVDGSLHSVHTSRESAQQAGVRNGASPQGWRSSQVSDEEALRSTWVIFRRPLDQERPWLTLRATPTQVWVVLASGGTPYSVHSQEADARRVAEAAGITAPFLSLHCLRLESADAAPVGR